MADAQKKVIVRLWGSGTSGTMAGYLPASGFSTSGIVSMMDTTGRLISIQTSDIKLIGYVRDFNLADTAEPERMGRRAFLGRPRGPGLWLRLTFQDKDTLEGLAADNLSFVDSLLEDGGVFVTPPDARSNTLRVFVPRAALTGFEVLGAVTTALRRKAIERAAGTSKEPQPSLFGDL